VGLHSCSQCARSKGGVEGFLIFKFSIVPFYILYFSATILQELQSHETCVKQLQTQAAVCFCLLNTDFKSKGCLHVTRRCETETYNIMYYDRLCLLI
jgi:hypothetical protein